MDPESVVMETTATQTYSPTPNIINMQPDSFRFLKTEHREAWTRGGAQWLVVKVEKREWVKLEEISSSFYILRGMWM